MDIEDVEKIEKIIADRKAVHSFLSKHSEVYRVFLDLEEKTYSDGSLEAKYKELIAIGIAIIINCESCLEWHIRKALNHGMSKKQVLEAIEVAIEMGGGPATVSSRFAITVLDYFTENSQKSFPLSSSLVI
ncbi:MAG: carboxymuconolactone decarboxylase family protein [Candidatus Odinarchaeota archaeon]